MASPSNSLEELKKEGFIRGTVSFYFSLPDHTGYIHVADRTYPCRVFVDLDHENYHKTFETLDEAIDFALQEKKRLCP